jgi:putative membrane-bound lytic murein transglycosylase D
MMNRIYQYFCSLAFACVATSASAAMILPANDTIRVSDVDYHTTNPASEVTPTEGMLHSVDTQVDGWYMKKYMRVDSTLYTNEIPVFPREVYLDRLRRLPNLIEMPYNDVVQDYIDQYTGRLRRSVSFMLGVQNFYVPIFEEALEAEGVPLELKYLPVVESAFDPMATSRVGAAGLWQFMVPTAKHYGLTVNSLLDERRDPIKSSQAAARYLKDLYNSFGDWTLAIAAYNCGRNNVLKAIKRAGGARDYWAIYPYLPRETRGYVPAFIAANYVMNYYCDHKIPPMKTIAPAETDTVTVSRNLYLAQVAAACNLDVETVQAMNPQYRAGVVPGNSQPCALRLPVQSIDRFLQLGDSIYNVAPAAEVAERREEVEPAELTAQPNNTTTRQSRRQALAEERRERRERRAAAAAERKKRKSKRAHAEESSEVDIRQGDTLSEIARRNNTTVEKLQKINNLNGSAIRAGKKLRVK